jgi:hypothetical protein
MKMRLKQSRYVSKISLWRSTVLPLPLGPKMTDRELPCNVVLRLLYGVFLHARGFYFRCFTHNKVLDKGLSMMRRNVVR